MAKRELLRHQEIERSILTKYRGKLWGPFVRAIKEYELVKPNDKICVCISGGKDSSLLAKLFEELQKHSDFPFEVKYLVMNPGYIESVQKTIYNNLDVLNIKAHIEETDIFEIANAQKNGGCYLCAKMRRGALYRIAKEMGCNKIALGHHYDDVIQTILMNMLNAGSFQTMMPKLHSVNFPGMELIRPLYCVHEEAILAWCRYNDLHFIQCACRFTERNSQAEDGVGESKRQEVKLLLRTLRETNPNVEQSVFKALHAVCLDTFPGYKSHGEVHSFLDNY
jgi:tRNA(Ile)-lysidine synthase TilS/MesJ